MKVIKFGAIWCPGCLVMKPRWAEVEAENNWLETEYFDADERADLIKSYCIDSLPTFIFLDKEGNEIHRLVGEVKKQKLIELITEFKNR